VNIIIITTTTTHNKTMISDLELPDMKLSFQLCPECFEAVSKSSFLKIAVDLRWDSHQVVLPGSES
jgi:hypothetical protein